MKVSKVGILILYIRVVKQYNHYNLGMLRLISSVSFVFYLPNNAAKGIRIYYYLLLLLTIHKYFLISY